MPILKLNSIISTPDGRQLQQNSFVSINKEDLAVYYPDTFQEVKANVSDLTVHPYRLEQVEEVETVETVEIPAPAEQVEQVEQVEEVETVEDNNFKKSSGKRR